MTFWDHFLTLPAFICDFLGSFVNTSGIILNFFGNIWDYFEHIFNISKILTGSLQHCRCQPTCLATTFTGGDQLYQRRASCPFPGLHNQNKQIMFISTQMVSIIFPRLEYSQFIKNKPKFIEKTLWNNVKNTSRKSINKK